MKKIISIMIMLTILIAGFVIAERDIDNRFRYGTIDINGDLITTTTPIDDVNVIGFICSSAHCSSVSGTLWGGSVLNSGDDEIQLTYPTSLLSSFGYGVYSYKDGYIPYEVAANWWGTCASCDPQGPFNNYLSRKEICVSEIENFELTHNGNVDISLDVNSPIEHAGPLEYVPPLIESHYRVDVDVNLEVTKNGLPFYIDSEALNIEYSGLEHVNFSFPLAGPGEYYVYVYTETNDDKCIDYNPDEEDETIFIGECEDNEDCPDNYYDESYCLDNDTWHDFHVFSCIDYECHEDTIPELAKDCGEDYCDSWQDNYCIGQDIYHNRTCYDLGCDSGACFNISSIEEQFIEHCPEACVNGGCVNITCDEDSDCGLEACFEEDNYCSGLELYNNYTYFACQHPGTPESYCSQEFFSDIIAYCVFNCQDRMCVTN